MHNWRHQTTRWHHRHTRRCHGAIVFEVREPFMENLVIHNEMTRGVTENAITWTDDSWDTKCRSDPKCRPWGSDMTSMICYLNFLTASKNRQTKQDVCIIWSFLYNPPPLRGSHTSGQLESRREPLCIYVPVKEPLELEGVGGGVTSVRILRREWGNGDRLGEGWWLGKGLWRNERSSSFRNRRWYDRRIS